MCGPKFFLQKAARAVGLYDRLKASCLYDLYWSVVDRKLIENRRLEVGFYRRLLQGFHSGDLIFDIGANDGTKTTVFLKLGARILAVEPDENNQQVLRRKFLSYRLFTKPVTIVGKAVSATRGTETMWVTAPGSWMNTLNPKWAQTLGKDGARFGSTLNFSQQIKVETTTVADLIAEFGTPFYLKIDVEGYEKQVLQGLKSKVPYLSFEVNLPEFTAEGAECIKLLEALEFNGEFNYAIEPQQGLLLESWLSARDFLPVYAGIDARCIEVFWRTK